MKVFIHKIIDPYVSPLKGFEECTGIELAFYEHLSKYKNSVKKAKLADVVYIPFFAASAYYTLGAAGMRMLWQEKYVRTLPSSEILDRIPHFIVWGYVLYDIDLSFIDPRIYIVALEAEATILSTGKKAERQDRMVVIPYILNHQTHPSALGSVEVSTATLNKARADLPISYWKRRGIAYIGKNRLTERETIVDRMTTLFGKDYILRRDPSLVDAFKVYQQTLAAFILKGDTPTRKAFYQAMAAGCIPIVFESTLLHYDDIYRGGLQSLRQNIISIPDYGKKIDCEYLNYISEVVRSELNEKATLENALIVSERFKDLDWFSMIEEIPVPVYRAMESLLPGHKRDAVGKMPMVYILDTRKEIDFIKTCLPLHINKLETVDSLTFQNDGFGERLGPNIFLTSQYSLELILNAFMEKYPLRTYCYNKADIIYVPSLSFLSSWSTTSYFYDVNASAKHVKSVIAKIDGLDPRPHIIAYSDVLWPDKRVCFNNLEAFPENLKIVAFDNVANEAVIKAPYPCELHVEQHDWKPEWQSERQYLLGYIGRMRQSVQKLLEEKTNEKLFRHIILDLEGWKSMNTREGIHQVSLVYKSSIFSLQPHGDMPTRRGFYQSLIYGCIPVVFKDNCNAYDGIGGVRIGDIAVVLDSDNHVLEELASISKESILRMRNNIRKAIKVIQYSKYPDGNDALSYILSKAVIAGSGSMRKKPLMHWPGSPGSQYFAWRITAMGLASICGYLRIGSTTFFDIIASVVKPCLVIFRYFVVRVWPWLKSSLGSKLYRVLVNRRFRH